MTNKDSFSESIIHSSHCILGIKLRPFCLLHYIWLESIQSPVIGGGIPTYEDFLIAATICGSASNEEIFSRLKVTLFRKVYFLFRKFLFRENFASQFNAYFEDYLSLPDLAESKDEKDNPIPIPLTYISLVLSKTNIGLNDVLLMPFNLLVWLVLSLSYMETGKTSLISDKERQIEDMLRSLTLG